MNDDYLSASQVAKLKNVSRNAVYKAISEGRLLATQIVGVVAIKKTDAQAWEPKAAQGRRKGTRLSEEAKAKISESQRKRWQTGRKGHS